MSGFNVGDQVRFKPGYGTYGYEDCLEADGRVGGIVVGFTTSKKQPRVRVQLTLYHCVDGRRGAGHIVCRAVDAASLVRA